MSATVEGGTPQNNTFNIFYRKKKKEIEERGEHHLPLLRPPSSNNIFKSCAAVFCIFFFLSFSIKSWNNKSLAPLVRTGYKNTQNYISYNNHNIHKSQITFSRNSTPYIGEKNWSKSLNRATWIEAKRQRFFFRFNFLWRKADEGVEGGPRMRVQWRWALQRRRKESSCRWFTYFERWLKTLSSAGWMGGRGWSGLEKWNEGVRFLSPPPSPSVSVSTTNDFSSLVHSATAVTFIPRIRAYNPTSSINQRR